MNSVVNGSENTVKIISEYYKAGKIGIVYDLGLEKSARSKGAELIRAGYSVEYYSVSERGRKIDEGCRYFLVIGGDNAAEFMSGICARWCMVCVEPKLNYMYQVEYGAGNGYRLTSRNCADCYMLESMSDRDIKAGLYGELFSVYQILLDYRLRSFIDNCDYINQENLSKLDNFMSLDKFSAEDLTAALNVALKIVNAGITPSPGVFIASDIVSKDKGINYGDASLLCSMCYLYSAYSLIGVEIELAMPVEKSKIAEKLGYATGVDRDVIIRAFGIIPYDAILNNDYIIKEYSQELKSFISSRFHVFTNACKIWRRLKSDVGRGARAITIKETADIIGNTCLIGNEYGILRHYKEMGIA